MSELRELYQEMIIDHNRRPRNFQKLDGASCSLEGYNPLCGDRIILDLHVEDDVITDVGFQGAGCAISRAAASMMTESIKGKSKPEVEEIFNAFHQMIVRGPGSDFDADKLGDLQILSGVSEFPTRVKCVMLSWHTLRSALQGRGESVSTE